MINVTELRAGTTFEENGQPWRVLQYTHTKMGRGTANIKVKAKNLKTGAIVNKNYISGARVHEAQVERRVMQFLYRDGDECHLMDPQSFEQEIIGVKNLAGSENFLREGMKVTVVYWADKPLDLELPPKVKMKVAKTAPGVKGNSATNLYKPAVMENGLALKVPLFVKENEEIIVDTRTGEYVERG